MSKVYLTYDWEFNLIGMLNGLTTVFFSVGLALWSLAAGIITSLISCSQLSPECHALLDYGPPIAGILGLVCFGVAGWAAWKNKGIKDNIKTESVEVKI
jgi:hypothetical protein